MLGQLNKILEISDSEAGLKVEKSGVFSEKKVNAEMITGQRETKPDIEAEAPSIPYNAN